MHHPGLVLGYPKRVSTAAVAPWTLPPVQAVRTEGVYANGSVTVRPLPEEVHGQSAERTVPLRRLEGGQIRQQELDDHLAKERVKVGT